MNYTMQQFKYDHAERQAKVEKVNLLKPSEEIENRGKRTRKQR